MNITKNTTYILTAQVRDNLTNTTTTRTKTLTAQVVSTAYNRARCNTADTINLLAYGVFAADADGYLTIVPNTATLTAR